MDEARLRGWKSIAAYLGVTQSTAIRWTKDPDFPVLRSGSGGSVYAIPADLNAWLAKREALGDEVPLDDPADVIVVPDGGAPDGGAPDGRALDRIAPAPPAPDAPADRAVAPDRPAPDPPAPDLAAARPPIAAPAQTPSRPSRQTWLLIALVASVAAVAIGSATLRQRETTTATAIPPEAARMLLDARQEMATRTPDSLGRAIAGFKAVIVRFPDLPGGFTGLADSYLLSCEFASMSRAQAYPAARAAVRTALALAPADPDAHRIMGFLLYWTTRDIDRAIPDFEAAVAGDRPNYLASMWYGNALIDAGRIDPGVAQLDRALAAAPDSPAVITNNAIARWQAGDEEGALRRLDEVGRRFPEHSAAPGFAGLFRLSRGDVTGYLRDAERWAALIGNPALTARIVRERAAETAGGDAATLRTLAAADPIPTPFWYGGRLLSAIAASQLGDRERLLAILRSPDIPGENWRPLRFPAEAFRRWKGDSAVEPLLVHAMGAPAERLWPDQPHKS